MKVTSRRVLLTAQSGALPATQPSMKIYVGPAPAGASLAAPGALAGKTWEFVGGRLASFWDYFLKMGLAEQGARVLSIPAL